jgi:hypothetical protein
MPGANTVTDTVKAPEVRQTQIAYNRQKKGSYSTTSSARDKA